MSKTRSSTPEKRLIKFTDGAGKFTQYAYDTAGNLTSITDPNNNITRIGYDTGNRVQWIANPGITCHPWRKDPPCPTPLPPRPAPLTPPPP